MLWLELLHSCPPLAGKQGELQGRCQLLSGGQRAGSGWGIFGGWEDSEGTSYWKLQCGEQKADWGEGPQNDPRHFSKSQRNIMALTEMSSSLCTEMELSPSHDGKREKPGAE